MRLAQDESGTDLKPNPVWRGMIIFGGAAILLGVASLAIPEDFISPIPPEMVASIIVLFGVALLLIGVIGKFRIQLKSAHMAINHITTAVPPQLNVKLNQDIIELKKKYIEEQEEQDKSAIARNESIKIAKESARPRRARQVQNKPLDAAIAEQYSARRKRSETMDSLDDHGQPLNKCFNSARLSDRSMDEFIGIAKGVLFDGVVITQEARMILNWIEKNGDVANQWPINHIFIRLKQMLSDNVLDQAEQSELLDLLLKVTGEKLEEFSPDNNSTCLPIDNPEPEIDFNGKLFCFTGKFVYGTRAQCQKAVELRGGQCIKSPNKDLNYLIIGSIGSREWIHSTHGRKIEEAVKYRDELQLPIAIVSEYHWTSQIEQA